MPTLKPDLSVDSHPWGALFRLLFLLFSLTITATANAHHSFQATFNSGEPINAYSAGYAIATPVVDAEPGPVVEGEPEEERQSFLEWLEGSPLAIWVAESLYGYPITLGLHVVGLAIVVGLLIFVDLRLLNRLTEISLTSLRAPIRLAWVGFGINAVSGFALFSSQATYIIYSKPFLIKIACVFLGAFLAYYIQRQLKSNVTLWESSGPPGAVKAAAAVSLLCWVIAIFAGRLIAYL